MLMKKLPILFLFALAVITNVVRAQILNPVTWSWKAEPISKGEYKLIFTAKIDKGWHTYSQFIAEGGPVPTAITFENSNKDIQLIGKGFEKSSKPHSGHDPVS